MLLLIIISFSLSVTVFWRSGLWSLASFSVMAFSMGILSRWYLISYEDSWYKIFGALNLASYELHEALLACMLGLVTICFIFILGGKPQTNRDFPLTRYQTDFSITVLVILILYFLQITLYAIAYDGLSNAFLYLSQRVILPSTIATAANAISFVYLPLLISLAVSSLNSGRGRIALVVAVYILLMASTSIINGRGMIVVIIFATALALKNYGKKKLGFGAASGGVFIVSATIVIGYAWRASSQGKGTFLQSLRESLASTFERVSEAMPTLDAMIVAIEYVNRFGHDNGKLIFEGFLVLVPRSLWQEKPMFLQQKIGLLIGGNENSGLPVGVLGEGYVAFDVFGILAFASIFAVLVLISDKTIVRTPRSLIGGCWSTFTFTMVVYTCMRGGVQGAIIVSQILLVSAACLKIVYFLLPSRRLPATQGN